MNGKELQEYLQSKTFVDVDSIYTDRPNTAVSLSDLNGPYDKLSLPIYIDWSPRAHTTYDLNIVSDLRIAYRTVLYEGTTDDIIKYVNADRPLQIWPSLSKAVPVQIVENWEPYINAATQEQEP